MLPATPAPKQKLLLADGTSIIRRVDKGVKGEDSLEKAEGTLRSSWGSFMRALREHEPTHFLAAFDHGGETWRHRLYPNYKIHREPAPPMLMSQLPGFLERMNNSGMRTLRVPDVEADDTIASLALRAVARGFEVVVLASDKDMFKLLPSGILVYDHFESAWRDETWVFERFGVAPAQMTDFLALMGDETDGIPGVPGVGEKTAAKLLGEHGDLEGVLAAASATKGKLGERLRENAGAARLSRELAALKTDVDLGISPRDIRLPQSILDRALSIQTPNNVRTAHSAEAVAKQMDDAQWVVGEAVETTSSARPKQNPSAPRMRM